jgi:hypothetical protein
MASLAARSTTKATVSFCLIWLVSGINAVVMEPTENDNLEPSPARSHELYAMSKKISKSEPRTKLERASYVALIGECSTVPDTPEFRAIKSWQDKLEQSEKKHSDFTDTKNLYVDDRCFVPRRVCEVTVPSSDAVLLLPRDGPGSITLQSKDYDVVLGAANSIGTVARHSFASLLEKEGSLPILNLGRGAMGPHVYTDEPNWSQVAPVFNNARAVIICIMGGRHSPDSEMGNHGDLTAFKKLKAMFKSKKSSEVEHAKELIHESLASATKDYQELVRRIRAGAPSGHEPRILLVWQSSCPISGCTGLTEFPQYYMEQKGTQNVIASLGNVLGAEVIDASWGHLLPSPPIPIDQCSSCKTNAKKVCDADEARNDAQRAKRTCGRECGSVKSAYYPDDAAHALAARMIGAALRKG